MVCLSLLTAGVASTPAPAKAGIPHYWAGYVVHVSTTNIKVENKARTETLSFALVPHFKQVFSADGKTTYQMADIKPGMPVRIVYDQHLLGMRHADKIYVLNQVGAWVTSTGS